MPFLLPNQQRQSTDGNHYVIQKTQYIAMPRENDQAMVTGNTHKKLDEVQTTGF